MLPPYHVIWTSESLKKVASIMAYLEDSWSSKEIDQFLEKLQKQESLLSRHPKAFPLIEKGDGYRRCLLTKQITIYYKLEDKTVKIGYLFDTRQDPDTLNLEV